MWLSKKVNHQHHQLEKVAIIAMYCHLRLPDVIAFEASNLSCRRTQCRFF